MTLIGSLSFLGFTELSLKEFGKIIGGKVAMPKFALAGMAWQGHYLDTKGNTFGIHQADTNAK